jgi:FMN phosphatase YigB (HAD superfamily)
VVIRGVIFDLGKTLCFVDDKYEEEKCLSEVSGVPEAKIGILLKEICAARPGLSLRDFKEVLTERLKFESKRLLRHEIDGVINAALEHTYNQPDAIPALEWLRDRGVRLCLISNTTPIDRERILRQGISGFFDGVVLSCDVGIWKPDPRIFDIGFRMLDVPMSEICVTGDRIRTLILGVAGLGPKIVLVDRRITDVIVNEQLPVDAIVPNLISYIHLPLFSGD